jgi:hypothetical protein
MNELVKALVIFLMSNLILPNNVFQMTKTLQSRNKVKARKVVFNHGLKPMTGVERVTLTIKYKSAYSTHYPQVFRSNNSFTCIVPGKLTFENNRCMLQTNILPHNQCW